MLSKAPVIRPLSFRKVTREKKTIFYIFYYVSKLSIVGIQKKIFFFQSLFHKARKVAYFFQDPEFSKIKALVK